MLLLRLPKRSGAAKGALEDLGEIVFHVGGEMGRGESFQGFDIENFERAQFFIVAVDRAVISEVENELEAVVVQQSFAQMRVIDDLVRFDQRMGAERCGCDEKEKIDRVDRLESGKMGEDLGRIRRKDDADAILPEALV
jgi:hypothetical protein